MKSTTAGRQVETVLRYVKQQIGSGRLGPGERLPAERRLAERLGVGRAHVRKAFQLLEFYGIVRTYPQSGTVVAQEKMQVLEHMITDAQKIDRYDFASLVHVRVMLEVEAARLAARNRTGEDLAAIEAAPVDCERHFHTDERVSRDFAYRQAIARGGHNPVIASLLLVITPDVLRYYQKYKVCTVPTEEVFFEHRELLRCIAERDERRAEEMIRHHLASLCEFRGPATTTTTASNRAGDPGIIIARDTRRAARLEAKRYAEPCRKPFNTGSTNCSAVWALPPNSWPVRTTGSSCC